MGFCFLGGLTGNRSLALRGLNARHQYSFKANVNTTPPVIAPSDTEHLNNAIWRQNDLVGYDGDGYGFHADEIGSAVRLGQYPVACASDCLICAGGAHWRISLEKVSGGKGLTCSANGKRCFGDRS